MFVGAALLCAAFGLTFTANHNCDYVVLTATPDNNANITETFNRGIWKGELDGETVHECGVFHGRYQNEPVGFYWLLAKAFSVFSDAHAIFLMVVLLRLASPSVRNDTSEEMRENVKQVPGNIALQAFLLSLYSGLTLLMIPSAACHTNSQDPFGYHDTTCSLARGAYLAIAAICTWFVAGIVFSVVAMRGEDEREEEDPSSTTEPLLFTGYPMAGAVV